LLLSILLPGTLYLYKHQQDPQKVELTRKTDLTLQSKNCPRKGNFQNRTERDQKTKITTIGMCEHNSREYQEISIPRLNKPGQGENFPFGPRKTHRKGLKNQKEEKHKREE